MGKPTQPTNDTPGGSQSDSTGPNAPTDGEGLEVKRAVITSDAIKSGRIRVPGLRGLYRGTQFDDDGTSDKVVSAETVDAIRGQFPEFEIEELD